MSNRHNLRPLLSLWFGFTSRVDRATYIRWGVVLMTVKYLLDATVVWAVTAQWWSPARYLSPLWTVRTAQFPQAPGLLILWLGLVTLPFFWIGVSMSVRRAADAGREPFIGLGFAVPGLNWLVILVLALLPSSANPTWSPTPAEPEGPVPALRSALVAIAGATVVGLVMGALTAIGWGAYGLILFFITPLAMGVITGYALNRHHRRGAIETIGAAALATILTAGGLLLMALEGVVCLAMAAPIGLTIVIIGALVGRAIAVYGRPATASILIALLALPSLGLAERRMEEPVLYEVVTAIEVAAPPAIVWQHVIDFSDLPAPTDWVFRTGIAYPVRARLDGTGVGALRTCEFSTGAFVEPITAWEPGRRLAFDVRSQPAPMQEWSFSAGVHPPHLDTLLRSRRGEFRLSPGANGGTHLEGHTWYELTAAPSPYWRLWSDAIIHRIHQRVLEHVARQSLNEGP